MLSGFFSSHCTLLKPSTGAEQLSIWLLTFSASTPAPTFLFSWFTLSTLVAGVKQSSSWPLTSLELTHVHFFRFSRYPIFSTSARVERYKLQTFTFLDPPNVFPTLFFSWHYYRTFGRSGANFNMTVYVLGFVPISYFCFLPVAVISNHQEKKSGYQHDCLRSRM